MKYDEEDFENMVYPIYGLSPKSSVLKIYPKLAQIPDFKKSLDVDKDKAIRFIIYLFDPQSPLSSVDNDQGQATQLALSLAGFDIENGKYSQEIEDMIEFKNDTFASMVVSFLRSFNSPEWTNFKVQEMLYYQLVKRAFDNPTLMDPKKMASAVKNLSEARQEFLKNDSNVRLIERVYEFAFRENLEISVESIAFKLKDLKEGEKIFPDVDASTN